MNQNILPRGCMMSRETEKLRRSLENEHTNELESASPDGRRRIRKWVVKQVEEKLKVSYPLEYSRYKTGYRRIAFCD